MGRDYAVVTEEKRDRLNFPRNGRPSPWLQLLNLTGSNGRRIAT